MTTAIAPVPVQQFFDSNGNELTGGQLFTYVAGTMTPQTTYTDSTGSTPNTNPIILNSRGECAIWLTPGVAYKFILSPSTDTNPPTNAFWTADNIQPGIGVIASGGLLGNSSGVTGTPTTQTIGTNLSLSGGVLNGDVRGYISGLTLSNDATSPNSVVDISAGNCTDSLNVTAIALPAFTKQLLGPWVAGTGNLGLGVGLTVVINTWYYLFAIINGGIADVYFDTSPTAQFAPAGTTAFRRIGAIKTDTSGHIFSFVQIGDDFIWGTEKVDQNLTGSFTATPTLFALSTPLGITTKARLRVLSSNTAAWDTTMYTPFTTTAAGAPLLAGVNATGAACAVDLFTNTASQVEGYHTSATYGNLTLTTTGWIDSRGRFV